MRIARGGGVFIGGAVGLAVAAAPVWGPTGGWLRYGLFGVTLLVLALLTWFFRDPERMPDDIEDGRRAIAPSDGRVLQATMEGGRGRLVTYLNLFDVHVTRLPLTGTVDDQRREPGGHRPAPVREAAMNARVITDVETADGPMTVTQITGLLARRIVPYLRPGEHRDRGARLGLIRFGSRVELELPPGYRLQVEEGDRLLAGRTVVAVLEDDPANGGA